MGVFDSKSQDKVFREGAGSRFYPGLYIVKVQACKSFRGQKGDTFVVETEVLGVHSEHPLAPQAGQTASSTWSKGAEQWMHEKFIDRWWRFMAAAVGSAGDSYTDAQWKSASESAVDERQNAMAGKVLAVKGWTKDNDPDAYCNVQWETPTQEQYALCGLGDPAPAAADTPAPERALTADGTPIHRFPGGEWIVS